MPIRYGVYFYFDPQTEQALLQLKYRLAEEVAGIAPVKNRLRPHVTVLVFIDNDQPVVFERFHQFAKTQQAYEVALPRVGVFNDKNCVVFIEPEMNVALKASYQACADLYAMSKIGGYYLQLADWNPHVTLAKRMPEPALLAAAELAKQCWQPRQAQIAGVGLINLQRPGELLQGHAF